MKIFRDINHLPAFKHTALTLGTFDGVHLGHRQILDILKENAAETGGETVLLTFWPHPRKVLQPHSASLKILNTPEEKIDLLAQAGLDNLVVIPFTHAFSEMPYQDFISQVLAGALRVKTLVIGHDHHFGKNREGNFEQLQRYAKPYGYHLIQVEALHLGGTAVSSSQIRHLLQDGETEQANRMLGYTYAVTGTVIEGKKRGRELGFPTANLQPDDPDKLIPADGIYVTEVLHNGLWYRGMASIGYNPTFGDTGKTIEVNIFDFNRQIYNEKITIKFWRFIRKEIIFANGKDLIRQLEADKKETENFFTNL